MFAARGMHMSDATPLLLCLFGLFCTKSRPNPRKECPCKIMQPLLVPKAEGRTRKK